MLERCLIASQTRYSKEIRVKPTIKLAFAIAQAKPVSSIQPPSILLADHSVTSEVRELSELAVLTKRASEG